MIFKKIYTFSTIIPYSCTHAFPLSPFLVFLFLLVIGCNNASANTYIIGVSSENNLSKADELWRHTAEYLSRTIPEHNFKISVIEQENIENAFKDQRFNFLISDALIQTRLQSLFKLTPLVTKQNRTVRGDSTLTGSVIVSSAENPTITSYHDLYGKTIAAVNENSMSGFLAAWRELFNKGLNIHKQTKLLFSNGTPDEVIESVLTNKADAGIVQTGVLERMFTQKKIERSAINILAEKKTSTYPYILSTSLYPDTVFSSTSQIPFNITRKIKNALLSMPEFKVNEYEHFKWQAYQTNTSIIQLQNDIKNHLKKEFSTSTKVLFVIFCFVSFVALSLLLLTRHSSNISSKSIVIPFTIVIASTTALLFLWLVEEWTYNFKYEQYRLAKSLVSGTANNIALSISQKHKTIHTLLKNRKDILNELINIPSDPENMHILEESMNDHLPEYYAYTLINQEGLPILDNRTSRIGEICLDTIKNFSNHTDEYPESLILHGNNSSNYHFDIMDHLNQKNEIFFVSFKMDMIVSYLANANIPEQSLLLIRNDNPTILEASASGIKQSKWFDEKLTISQLQTSLFASPVAGTGWYLVSLPRPGLFQQYTSSLIQQASIAYTALMILIIFFISRLMREDHYQQKIRLELLRSEKFLKKTVRKRTRALNRKKQLAQVTLQSISDGVITTNIDCEIESINHVAEKLTGWFNEDTKGHVISHVFHIRHEQTRSVISDPVKHCLTTGETQTLENNTILIHKEGQNIQIEASASPIWDNDSQIVGVVLVFRDITQRQTYAREIEHQANHDALTGLINRKAFEKRLISAVDHSNLNRQEHALMFLDLDRFKIVNDSCGHAAGDELLKQVSQLMLGCLRTRDTLARIGGDEFGILLEGCPEDAAARVAENIRSSVENFHFYWKEQFFKIGSSIGVVRIKPDGVTPEDILNQADAACYAAKDEGRNRVYFYNDKVEKHRGESRCYVRLNAALENDLLRLYQQEITPINEEEIGKHIEILIRLQDAEDGRIIPPDAFLPIAERYNLMPTIDRWVVKSTLQWFENNPPQLAQLQLCTINLSGQSLTEADFLQFIHDIVSNSRVPAEKICFEITETVAISNINQARQFIDTVRDSGCKVALDDFGSGLSSYSYLKTLPVDFLKIDGSFVKDIEESEVDYAMVRSMNEVGHIMNIETIAEYVENKNILDLLREIGVDYAQGYHLAMPEPIENLAAGRENEKSLKDLNKHIA